MRFARATGTVSVPGAELYYESRGSGQPVLLAHPSGGDASYLAELAENLAPRYRVVTYDRRGHGRSRMSDPDAVPSVRQHSDDAARLLGMLGVRASHVFGSSAGAVVALELVTRHPEKVRVVIAHEPPAVSVLPDAGSLRESFGRVRDVFVAEGAMAAAEAFLGVVGASNPPAEARVRLAAEFDTGFGRELIPITSYRPDVEALRRRAARVVLGSGSAGPRSLGSRVVAALALQIGTSFISFPGNHWGYASGHAVNSPDEFAALVDRTFSSARPARPEDAVLEHEP